MTNQASVSISTSAQPVVEITGGGTPSVEVTVPGDPAVLEVLVPGPQGPPFADVDAVGKVDRSLIYYDGSSGMFKADATVTTTTLTDGGNF